MDFPNPYQDINRPVSPGEKEQRYGAILKNVASLLGVELTDHEAAMIIGIVLREAPNIGDRLK